MNMYDHIQWHPLLVNITLTCDLVTELDLIAELDIVTKSGTL